MSEKETHFADGMFVKQKRDGRPEFVLGEFSFKVEEFIRTLQAYKNQTGYVNVQLLKPKQSGKRPYIVVDTWGLDDAQLTAAKAHKEFSSEGPVKVVQRDDLGEIPF